MEWLVVAPAYCRKYKSAAAVRADWAAGKDFVIMGPPQHYGQYVSIREIQIGQHVEIRYGRMLDRLTVVTRTEDKA